jgi:hypothetical protein
MKTTIPTTVKRRRVIGWCAAISMVAIQFIPVALTNPPETADEIDAPPAVQAILQRSCYDCHSNETKWPMYSRIAPVSWLIVHDVNEGRSDLNFSEWQSESQASQSDMKEEILEKITEGDMPLKKYLLIHRHATLSPADKSILKTWVQAGSEDSEDPE